MLVDIKEPGTEPTDFTLSAGGALLLRMAIARGDHRSLGDFGKDACAEVAKSLDTADRSGEMLEDCSVPLVFDVHDAIGDARCFRTGFIGSIPAVLEEVAA